MERLASVSGLIFSAPCSLVPDQVRPGAAKSGGTHCLVGVYHDMMFGGFLDAIKVMVIHPLPVVILAAWDYVAHVAALDGIVAVFVHEVVGCLEVTFVVSGGG